MTRVGRALAVLSLLVWSPVAEAHPIHTTMSTVAVDGGALTLSIRVFADDFSASVAARAGRRAPADWSVADADVAAYLADRMRVRDAGGRLLTVHLCGIRRAGELYWLCARVDGVADSPGLRLENRLLTERHADQVNIVQVRVGAARRTLLFTRRAEVLALTE